MSGQESRIEEIKAEQRLAETRLNEEENAATAFRNSLLDEIDVTEERLAELRKKLDEADTNMTSLRNETSDRIRNLQDELNRLYNLGGGSDLGEQRQP